VRFIFGIARIREARVRLARNPNLSHLRSTQSTLDAADSSSGHGHPLKDQLISKAKTFQETIGAFVLWQEAPDDGAVVSIPFDIELEDHLCLGL
jgi:hypothetical protein